MPVQKPVYRIVITARDRATLLALLAKHRPDIGGSPHHSADGSVRIDAYVAADRVDELEADGVNIEIVGDETAAGRAAQAQVGRGNRFLTGDPVPRGVGRKVRNGDKPRDCDEPRGCDVS
jgi:hypothetical protein